MKKRNFLLVAIAMYLFPLLLLGCFDSTTDVVDDKPDIVDDGGDDFLDSIKGKTLDETEIDYLFEVLVEKIRTFEDVWEISDVYEEDFNEIAESFAGVIKADSSHMKANIGFAVARIAMLNSNKAIKEVADSIDRYIGDWEAYWDDENGIDSNGYTEGLFSKAYRRGGVNGLGTALFANSSKLIRTNNNVPSFPKMVTVSKIQDIIESEILPALNGAISAFENIENSASGSVLVSFDGESYEIDLGEVYLADASMRLLRHTLCFFTAYNYDAKSVDGQDIYKIIDDIAVISEKYNEDGVFDNRSTIFISDDSIITLRNDAQDIDVEYFGYLYDAISHNLNRAEFMSLQRSNHAKMYADIKAVPEKIKKAIQYIKAEDDNQENDLLKIADLDELDAEMIDIAADMKEDGLSSEFISHFKSPIYLADFISEILTNEYQFSEEIDGISFNYAVNLSKFYTNPVENLKDWFPLYQMKNKSEAIYLDTVDYGYSIWGTNYIYADSNDVVLVGEEYIDSIVPQFGSTVKYYLNKSFAAKVTKYYDYEFMPVELVDPSGNKLVTELDDLEDALFDETLFPHFKDYTFNGIFPDMTRARWIKLVQDIDGL